MEISVKTLKEVVKLFKTLGMDFKFEVEKSILHIAVMDSGNQCSVEMYMKTDLLNGKYIYSSEYIYDVIKDMNGIIEIKIHKDKEESCLKLLMIRGKIGDELITICLAPLITEDFKMPRLPKWED